tara:strand:+ start:1793 stop:2401 length:609 start_codon:yes stop_codon:yes gene_type:complete
MSNKKEIYDKLKKLLGDIDQQKFNEITWTLPQNKNLFIITNKGCQMIAAKQGLYVHYDQPIVIQDNIVIKAKVTTKDSNLIESFGEANSKNCRNPYPISMAEKRGHDRVILKACDVYGDIYSEEENKEEFNITKGKPIGFQEVEHKNKLDGFMYEIDNIKDQDEFDSAWGDLQVRLKSSGFTTPDKQKIHSHIISKFKINNQ